MNAARATAASNTMSCACSTTQQPPAALATDGGIGDDKDDDDNRDVSESDGKAARATLRSAALPSAESTQSTKAFATRDKSVRIEAPREKSAPALSSSPSVQAAGRTLGSRVLERASISTNDGKLPVLLLLEASSSPLLLSLLMVLLSRSQRNLWYNFAVLTRRIGCRWDAAVHGDDEDERGHETTTTSPAACLLSALSLESLVLCVPSMTEMTDRCRATETAASPWMLRSRWHCTRSATLSALTHGGTSRRAAGRKPRLTRRRSAKKEGEIGDCETHQEKQRTKRHEARTFGDLGSSLDAHVPSPRHFILHFFPCFSLHACWWFCGCPPRARGCAVWLGNVAEESVRSSAHRLRAAATGLHPR